MKRLAASIASWVLGMVGWWSLQLQERVQVWGGMDPTDIDYYKPGGTISDDD